MRIAETAILGALATLAFVGAAAAQPAPLRMTCHELLQGEPLKDPIVYEVVGRNLFRTSVEGERIIISTEGDRRYLGTTRDKRGAQRSYASHVLRGQVLTRELFWEREGGRPRLISTERFDFGAQRYGDPSRGEDHCHHDGRR